MGSAYSRTTSEGAGKSTPSLGGRRPSTAGASSSSNTRSGGQGPVPRLSLSLSTTATTRGKADGKEAVKDAKEEKENDGKEKPKYALTEAEKADKWDHLLLISERACGTLRAGVGLGY